jgi:hypothetical protein
MIRPLLPLLFALTAAIAAPTGAARELSVALGLGAPQPAGPRAQLTLHDLRVGDDTFDVGVGWLDGAPAAAASWRRTVAAGPIGTLVVDGRVGTDAGGIGATLGVRGTAGPVALRIAVDGGTRVPGAHAVLERGRGTDVVVDAARLTGAPAGSWRVDLAGGATWRPDRRWTWDLEPRVHLGPSGWAGGAALALRRAAVATDVDLSAGVDLAFGPTDRHLLAGLTLHHVPRRAPESRATLWWGGDVGAWSPGVEVSWIVREAGAQATIAGGWVPGRADRPVGYASFRLRAPAPVGSALVAAAWRSEGGGSIDVGWTLPLDR